MTVYSYFYISSINSMETIPASISEYTNENTNVDDDKRFTKMMNAIDNIMEYIENEKAVKRSLIDTNNKLCTEIRNMKERIHNLEQTLNDYRLNYHNARRLNYSIIT